MAYEMKPNSGTMFKNIKKSSDGQPDMRGECLIDGKKLQVSGWKKTDKNGNPWYSLAFRPFEENRSNYPTPPQNTSDNW
jgi:hypothetical protein